MVCLLKSLGPGGLNRQGKQLSHFERPLKSDTELMSREVDTREPHGKAIQGPRSLKCQLYAAGRCVLKMVV